MPLGPSTSAVYVQAPTTAIPNPSRILPSVTIHPTALFSILDHFLRRTDEQPRVIGTLLGARSEDNERIEVLSSFPVLHSETAEQVAVDMEYHRTMYDLSQRGGSGKEVIVGWYSTGEHLNTYSALIQNFYSQETAPYQAVHVTMNTGTVEGEETGVKAYISSPVGVYPKPENCIFIPVPVELKVQPPEQSGLELLSSVGANPLSLNSPQTDTLYQTLASVNDMIDRVLAYVRRVLSGEIQGDPEVGRYLLEIFNTSTKGFEKGWNTHLQDTVMMSYLAVLVRSQSEVASRLALVT